MHKRIQDELEKFKGDTVPINNSSHMAFVERLKKQVSSDDSSSSGDADSGDDDICSEELMKELEAKFDELFANLDDDD